MRRIIFSTGMLIAFVFVLYLVRRPLLRGIGNLLISEDTKTPCGALFVLSGGPSSRAAEAALLLKQGYAPYVVCTGESTPYLFDILDIKMDEADLTKKALISEGVPDSLIHLIHSGTSTREESKVILDYCRKKGIKKAMVLSDKFHTNRIDYAFRKDYELQGIELILRGAPSNAYNENNWWATESGLIMVNNEYIKLFYYYLYY